MIMRSVHPGEVLRDELEFLEINATEFARQIAAPPGRVHQIIAGKIAVTDGTTARFGRWFGVDPQFWFNLQSQFEAIKVDKQTKKATRRSNSEVGKGLSQLRPREKCLGATLQPTEWEEGGERSASEANGDSERRFDGK